MGQETARGRQEMSPQLRFDLMTSLTEDRNFVPKPQSSEKHVVMKRPLFEIVGR